MAHQLLIFTVVKSRQRKVIMCTLYMYNVHVHVHHDICRHIQRAIGAGENIKVSERNM